MAKKKVTDKERIESLFGEDELDFATVKDEEDYWEAEDIA